MMIRDTARPLLGWTKPETPEGLAVVSSEAYRFLGGSAPRIYCCGPGTSSTSVVIVPTVRLPTLALVGICPVPISGCQDLTRHFDDHRPRNFGYPRP